MLAWRAIIVQFVIISGVQAMSDSKLDMQSILGNLKNLKNNILPHNAGTPRPVDGDTLGAALADISAKAKQAAKAHADITQILYDIEHGINQLYADIETLRNAHPAANKEDTAPVAEASTESAAAEVETTTATAEAVTESVATETTTAE